MLAIRADEGLLRAFDEATVILSMLGPSKWSRPQHRNTETSTGQLDNRWHLFLDHLCWLCNYKTGGKTVVSITAEETLHGSKLWVASNAPCVSRITKHLKRMLQELQSFAMNADSSIEDTQRRVFRRFIVFSHERIAFYAEKLH